MHIIRAFTHLQVQSIPEKYIFKRYTCDARSLVPWDRHDVVQVGPRGDTKQSRMSKLLPKLMRLGRVGSKTDRAYAETVRHLDRITPGIELLQAIEVDSSMHPTNSTGAESGELQAVDTIQNVDAAASTLDCSAAVVETNENQAEINLDPTSANFLASISLAEPPVSHTKGRKSGKESQCAEKIKGTNNPYSTYTRSYGKKSVPHMQCYWTLQHNMPAKPKQEQSSREQKKKEGYQNTRWDSEKERSAKNTEGKE